MYQIFISEYFLKLIRPLVKKYPHTYTDVVKELNNFDPEFAIGLGSGLYKVRLKSSDIKRGKSKSFRLIIFLWKQDNLLTPVIIYFKGIRENISKKEALRHLGFILAEIER